MSEFPGLACSPGVSEATDGTEQWRRQILTRARLSWLARLRPPRLRGPKSQYDPSFSLLKQLHDLAQAVVTSGGTTINLAMADFQMIAPYFS